MLAAENRYVRCGGECIIHVWPRVPGSGVILCEEGEAMRQHFNAGGAAMTAVILCIALLCCGCMYAKDRGNDFLDIVWIDVGIGLGAGIDFQATDFVHSGLMASHFVDKAGLARREFDTWHESNGSLILGRYVQYNHILTLAFAEGIEVNRYAAYGVRSGDLINVPRAFRPYDEVELLYGFHVENRQAPYLNLLDVDVGVMVLWVGGRVGLSPGEAVDFVLGWFGLDIGKDDTDDESGPPSPEAALRRLRPGTGQEPDGSGESK